MPTSKAPRYFCEHCGAEVAREARVCPGCGRFFSSVKCPKCGYAARPARFVNGCPVCGHTGAVESFPRVPVPAREAAPLSGVFYFLAVALLVAALAALWTVLR